MTTAAAKTGFWGIYIPKEKGYDSVAGRTAVYNTTTTFNSTPNSTSNQNPSTSPRVLHSKRASVSTSSNGASPPVPATSFFSTSSGKPIKSKTKTTSPNLSNNLNSASYLNYNNNNQNNSINNPYNSYNPNPILSMSHSTSAERTPSPATATSPPTSPPTTSSVSDFYELKADMPKGFYDFKNLEGKVTLIVNVASKCGFTGQYTALEALYEKYKDHGFVILGFPSNQFGGQEPGTDDEIASFCQLNHGVSFPLMKKSDVNGDHANEVYKYLKSQKSGVFGLMNRIKWNFEKFLIDQNGHVVQRYGSITKPETIDSDVANLLGLSPKNSPKSAKSPKI